jgi:1-acyl-sn-glycerol-3-phosphate acyltransferase
MLRDSISFVVTILVWLLARVETIGLENVPSQGGYILATNHMSILDPVLIFVYIRRKDLTALVAKKHQKNPLFRWLVDGVGGIWLNRDDPDAHAIRASRDYLQKGGLLGISPEGTRSPSGALIPAKTGVAYLADVAEVPIIPVAITGTHNGIQRAFTFQRPRFTLRFGCPFSLPPVDRRSRETDLKRNTDEIMCRIAAMLPAELHGVYADHPRIKELVINSSCYPALKGRKFR